jgi:hypothetical protein
MTNPCRSGSDSCQAVTSASRLSLYLLTVPFSHEGILR